MTTESVNERDLLSAAMQGSQIAYRELIHLHQDAAYRFAWALLGDEHAQTVTENAFITAWKQLDYLSELHCTFRERLLQLICIDADQINKRPSLRRLQQSAPQDEAALNQPCVTLRCDPRTNMEHLALQTDIEEALQLLPLHYREVLLLHTMGGLVDTQIADLIGSTSEAVHEDLSRARAAVRRQIIANGGFFPAETSTSNEKFQACRMYLPTLSAAADDLCTAAEKEQLNAHLSTCPGCRNYYASLCALNHGISVMKREVPGDMVSYIIHKIQEEDGKGDFAAPGEQPKRPRFQLAFGRFTIIGLCLALLLLAYSHSLQNREDPASGTPEPPAQSETVTPPAEKDPAEPAPSRPEAPPASTEAPTEPGTETPSPEEPAVPEEEQPSDTPPDAEAGSGGSIVPGGDTSTDQVIPSGETYAGIYTLSGAASELMAQHNFMSFRSSLSDGTRVQYYIVPADQNEALTEALSGIGLVPAVYGDAPEAVDTTASRFLYMIFS